MSNKILVPPTERQIEVAARFEDPAARLDHYF